MEFIPGESLSAISRRARRLGQAMLRDLELLATSLGLFPNAAPGRLQDPGGDPPHRLLARREAHPAAGEPAVPVEQEARGHPFLRDRIVASCKQLGLPVDLKYLDPAYYIRGVAANSEDSLLCDQLARHAVHAGMAGSTDVLIGFWYNVSTQVPIELVVNQRKQISESNEIWRSVLRTTGQAARFR